MAGRLPAAAHHGASMGGKTREEALIPNENAIPMILTEMERNGVSPPADEPVPGGGVLTFATEEEAE